MAIDRGGAVTVFGVLGMLGLRFVYLLATGTDPPVVQCGLAGVVLLIASRQSCTGQARREPTPPPSRRREA